jgi:hypothetical protein
MYLPQSPTAVFDTWNMEPGGTARFSTGTRTAAMPSRTRKTQPARSIFSKRNRVSIIPPPGP